MTIVRLSRTYPRKNMPGMGLHTYNYSKFIKKDTLIITKYFDSPVIDIPENVDLVEISYSDMSFKKQKEARWRLPLIVIGKIYGDLRFMIGALKHIRKNTVSVDIIHLHTHTYILTALFLKFLFKAPVVAGFHGTDLIRMESHPIMQKLLQYVDKILYVSTAMEEKLLNYFPQEKTQYIGNFVDLSFFTPTREARSNIFLAVGNLRWQKDFSTLLNAFYLVAEKLPNYQLLIVGEGPDREKLEKKIEELHLEDQVFMPGTKNRQEVCQLFRTCRTLVLSSVAEGFPKVIIEAMACQTPVIATEAGDCPSVVSKAGIIIPIENPQALADAMIKMATDEELRNACILHCGVQASKFSLVTLISKIENVYAEVVNS